MGRLRSLRGSGIEHEQEVRGGSAGSAVDTELADARSVPVANDRNVTSGAAEGNTTVERSVEVSRRNVDRQPPRRVCTRRVGQVEVLDADVHRAVVEHGVVI